MEKGKIQLTQKDAENTPAGGVVVGKRDGQTMIYDDASLGGYFVGKLHKDGGIKMINKSTGQPLEVQGSEVIITAPAVNDQTKREFEGKMMTNREILSKINSDGGGVSFADGGDIPAKIHTTDCEYKFGGKVVKDTDIAHSLGMNSTLKKGKQHFSSGDTTYDVDGIYNAIKKGKLRLKTKEVKTFPMKYPVYDKKYSETVKTDFRKPNGITVRTESGEEVLIDGNHRMNNAYLKGRKTMKTYYIEDPKQIAKFTKKNKFELGGEYKSGGHLSKGKSLKQIAEMHNVSLAHINEELAKGLEVEKEHFTDFKERTRVAKDHLVENPNYYTILAKAGLKNGGSFNNGGSVSKENEFTFNKKSDRLKSFYKTNNPSIDSLLIECQPFINDLIEQQKKLVLKLSLDTNGIETPMSEFAIEQYEIGLIFKMVQSFNKYLKTTDILTDVTIKNVGLFEISATVIRDGKKYSFRTELIPAGGYNIQEFHYRYITKTDLPESKENSAIDNLKSKLSVFKKIKSLEDDINRNIKSISDLEKYIKQGYYGDDDDDKLYRVDLNKEAILYEQENIERYKKEIEKLKIKQNDLESVLISLDKFKNGGHILSHHRHSENLVKDAKSGNTPARDLNNYNDIMDLGADGAVGGDSGLAFAKGGVVYDTTKPKIEKVTIKSTMYGRASIVGRNASNVSELKDIIIDYVRNSTDDEDMIIFYVNDNTRGSYSINLNKGKKNTVKNVNTETVNAENIKRVIDNYTYLVKNYDWTDFFSGTQKSSFINKKENSPDLVRLEYSLKGSQLYIPFRTGVDLLKEFFKIEKYCIENPNESVNVKIIAEVTDSKGVITATERNITFGEKHFKPRNWTNTAIENLMTKDWFSDKLDFTDFFKSSSKNLTSTKTLLTKDELFNSKIWIGDDLKLLEQVKEKLESLGFYKDKVESGDKNISVFIFINDFYIMALREKSDLFNDSSLKEIFPSDLGIDLTTMGVAPITSNASTSAKPFDLTSTKIWIGDNPELSKAIQEKAFELGWEWVSGKEVRATFRKALFFNYNKIIIGDNLSDTKIRFNERNTEFSEIFPSDLGIDVNNLGASASQTPIAMANPAISLDNEVQSVLIENDGGEYTALNGESFLEMIRDIWDSKDKTIRIIPQGRISALSSSKTIDLVGYVNNGAFEINPDETTLAELGQKFGKEKEWFKNLDWTSFFKENTSTMAKPFDFTDTKIDVEDNPELSIKVQQKAFELGWEWQNGGGKNLNNDTFNYLYFTKTTISYGNTTSSFLKSPKRKITEEEIFGSQAPASVQKTNVVNSVRLNFEKQDGTPYDKITATSGKELFKELDYAENNWLSADDDFFSVWFIAYYTDKNGSINSISESFNFGDNFFVPSSWSYESFKELVNKDWFNNKLDFSEFFDKTYIASSGLFNFTDTKIWIGDNPELSRRVQEKAFESGWEWTDEGKKVLFTDKKVLFFRKDGSIGYYLNADKKDFDAVKYREITEQDIFGSQTTNNAKPIVYKIMFVTKQKNNSYPPNIETAKSFDEFFTILKGLVEIKDTLDDNVILRIINEDKMKEYNLSLTLEKDMFDLLTDIEAKENLMEGLSANNKELDFKEFFSSSAQPLLTDLKSTKIFVNGDKDLIEKVIKKAEQLGWADNEAIKRQGNVSAIYFSRGKYVGWLSEEEFKQNINYKEIFPSDLGIDYNTSNVANTTSSSAQPFDLTNTKIWIGDNPELSKRVQEKAFELGWRWADNPKDIVDNLQALVFEKEYITTRGFKDNKYDKSVFDGLNQKEIFASDLGIGTSISNLSDERLKLLFDLKQIVDKENLEVLPANIETNLEQDEIILDFVDEDTGDVFEIKKGQKNIKPMDEKSSKFLFDFFEFQKDFDSFSLKKAQELLSSYIADESKLYTTEFEKFEGDLSKAKKDLEDLKKLLPAFQQTKFAPQRALIMSEIKKLNNKITKDGFIFTNELMSSANQLFTAQGLLKYYFDQTTQSPVQPLEPPCNLPTPNGMESKLPISAYFNVRTKQFKSWFGDWEKAYETNNYFDCSKMIDEETKEPKIYYHGVRKYIPNFGQFSNMGQGVVRPYGSFEPPTSFPASYFADNEEYAKFYGGVAKNMPKPSPDYEPFIYKVFLSVKNPLNLLPLGFEASYKDLLDYLFVAYGIKKTASANVLNRINNDMVSKHPVWVYVRNDISLLETIKEYGYDALIQIGDIPTFDEDGNPIDDRSKSMKEEEFLTFYPTQVKSATVLKSFYLDFFKDIRFNKGGYVRI